MGGGGFVILGMIQIVHIQINNFTLSAVGKGVSGKFTYLQNLIPP
jgi:hypothetical protein